LRIRSLANAVAADIAARPAKAACRLRPEVIANAALPAQDVQGQTAINAAASGCPPQGPAIREKP